MKAYETTSSSSVFTSTAIVDSPAVKMIDTLKENDAKIPQDTLFVDNAHFMEKGEAILAGGICKYIVEKNGSRL